MPSETLQVPARAKTSELPDRSLDAVIRLAMLLLALGNVGAVLAFFTVRWSALWSYRMEKMAVTGYVVVMVLAVQLGWWSRRIRPRVLLLNVSQALVVIALACADAVLTRMPSLLPTVLINFEPRLNPALEQARETLLDYLPYSPWVRFKPHILVRTIGDRRDDFVYTWTTDRFGFKNDDAFAERAARDGVAAVAIGDSFVEAAGVPTEETWVSRLSRRGFPTYNLGVQAFAPQQMAGALDRFGRHFRARYVLIGYTPGFEGRTLRVRDAGAKLGDPAFQSMLEPQYLQERRPSDIPRWRVLNAALELSKSRLRYLLRTRRARCHAAAPGSVFTPYCAEVQDGARVSFNPSGEPWRLTAASLEETARIAREMGASPVIVLFHSRAFLYYPRVMGRDAPADHYERRTAQTLRAWAQRHGVELIDTELVFVRYLAGVDESADVSALPFFLADGHIGPVGQRLVAEAVADTLGREAFAP
ncbi:MAG: hypothetical protein HY599_06505 [Candidatus Omnitrophica bacterium]|nr:hypothetical protein [Candidatus Omnitrophota bacterium]